MNTIYLICFSPKLLFLLTDTRGIRGKSNFGLRPTRSCEQLPCYVAWKQRKTPRLTVRKSNFMYDRRMKSKQLPKSFFDRPAEKVAPKLLGKYLLLKKGRHKFAGMITEVEAYTGQEDMACHASHGETKRNKIMFGPPGRWYVYLCYGMHWMLNTITGPGKSPSAVLIRACLLVAETGEHLSGPGRVTKFFGITKKFNGAKVSRVSGLWLEDRGVSISPRKINRTARIGVNYAGPKWAKKKLRWVVVCTSQSLRN